MGEKDRTSIDGLTTLQAIAQALSHSLNLQAILEKTADQIHAYMDVENLAFFLYEGESQTLTIKTYRGHPEAFIEKIRTIRLGEGLTGFAAQKKEMVISESVFEDPRSLQVFKEEGKQMGGCYIPLLSKGLLFGVLSLGYHQRHFFTKEEKQFLETIGNLISQAMENARLYEKIQIYSTRLEQMVDEALAQVKMLKGLLPICCNCKKIRDDKGNWNSLEAYIHKHSEAAFSHGICPVCLEDLYGDLEGGPLK